MAHVNFCHLFYSSSHTSTIISQVRNVFNEVIFGSKRTFYSQKDHLKPIFISQGQDSIQTLNVTGSTTANLNVFEIIKKQIGALFPSDEGDAKKQVMLKITKGGKDILGIRGR